MSYLKPTSAPSPTPSNASTGASKRKRNDEGNTTVYSQPAETGTGNHVYTQLTYTIEHLRGNQKWHSFEDIMQYLNIPKGDEQQRAQLENMFKSTNPQNRIEYSPANNKYRYKPKFDIRNADQLKGWLQNQKHAQGLSVKDLKDGWANVQEEIKGLEDRKEVLVKRNVKDNQARTVWNNDPSLMNKMDPEFQSEWHKTLLPANPDDLRSKLIQAGLKPSSAPREASNKPKEKKRKAPRRGGKQTNTHMANILKDFSHLRK
ncbi:transcription initiation factor IIE, beta subunit [Corynespora cassiicola Philippines]|uniref:Transcription initiation factor IIE subunit beta n=1 Tax=Corynespora cassiicola Philippines TaxID=1448308 RepID=A0A2T2P764_CORCC|nr:transcription initiation factor IIE, beta subunit [Corynespora cassiicola Philippines]